jgi:hypothetical protein
MKLFSTLQIEYSYTAYFVTSRHYILSDQFIMY